jgi:hypothetical protein
MKAERARGKLWMAAWRFTSGRVTPSRLERVWLADALKPVLQLGAHADLNEAYRRLVYAAEACADLSQPLTAALLGELRFAVQLAAAAAAPADASSPAGVGLPSGPPPHPKSSYYWEEGSFA